VESHIRRIYKRQKNNPEGLLGQVVDIQNEEKIVFSSVDDLIKILCSWERIPGNGEKEN
jgi:hypothetical protein